MSTHAFLLLPDRNTTGV